MGRKRIQKYTFDEDLNLLDRLKRTLHVLDCEEAAKALPQAMKIAEDRHLPYLEFLGLLFDPVLQTREAQRIDRWTRQAHFPWQKHLSDYEFEHPDFIDEDAVRQLGTCKWIASGANVIFFGPSGVGKTHLSIALGLEAIQRGYETRFVTADGLSDMIRDAADKDRATGRGEYRKKLLSTCTNTQLLIIDELAYSKIPEEVSDFLFQIICRRFEVQTSTIFTSNEGLETWKKFFGDNKVRAMAALDRILHDCTNINIQGTSYRLQGKKKK